MPEKTKAGSFDVAVPHLLLWGEADEALRPSTIEALPDFSPDLTIERFPDAGHWILHEKPREVALAMKRFLAAAPPALTPVPFGAELCQCMPLNQNGSG
jgi:pimeloyl-ACP methyl ester carboxylesterase